MARFTLAAAGTILWCLTAVADAAAPAKTFPLAHSSLVLDVVVTDGAIIAAADRGLILRSTDGGSTWSQAVVPSAEPPMLTGLALDKTGAGFAVGHDATIYGTSDGITWTERLRMPELETPLFAIWVENARHALAVGAYGLMQETFDGGVTWTERHIHEDQPHLYAITATSEGLYVVGEAGAIFRSVDSGATWSRLPSPYQGTWFGILALKDGGLLIHGLRGNLFRSDDAGQTWAQIATGTEASLLGAVQRRDGQVVVVGLSGTVLTSVDGRSFKLTAMPSREAFGGAQESRDGRLIVFGERGIHPLAEAAP